MVDLVSASSTATSSSSSSYSLSANHDGDYTPQVAAQTSSGSAVTSSTRLAS